LQVGAFASSRSNASVATGWGFFFGTLTAGNFGTAGSIFCLTAQASAVCRNCTRTLTVLGCISDPGVRPGSRRCAATNAERVHSLTDRSSFGFHSRSKEPRAIA
jgi:hypothetical protein